MLRLICAIPIARLAAWPLPSKARGQLYCVGTDVEFQDLTVMVGAMPATSARSMTACSVALSRTIFTETGMHCYRTTGTVSVFPSRC